MLKRFLLPALMLLAVALPSQAALLFSDNFAYADGPITNVSISPTATNWVEHSSGTTLIVAGGRALVTGTSAQDVSRSLGATQSVVFARFTVNATNLPTAAGSYFAHFRDNSTGFRARVVAQTNGAAPGAYRLGITAAGSASAAVVGQDLLLTNTYSVVMSWDGAANVAYLWVNPASDADLPVSEGGTGIVVTNFSFRQSGGIGALFVDDLAVGNTFAEVAPALNPTAILRAPAGVTANTGDSNALTVIANGAALSYQWKRDGGDVGLNTNVLRLPGISAGDAGNYTVTVTGANGVVTSAGVAVIVNAGTTPASITASPATANVALGSTVNFVVGAGGSNPIGYQWYFNSNLINGASASTLGLTAVTNANAGFYHAVASNAGGSATSAVAQLTVRGPIATNIAHLRTLQDASYLPSDTTNLYTAEGIVTSWATNLTTGGNVLVYMQDSNAAIAVFFGGSTNVPKAGDLIRVTGPLGTFNSLHEYNMTTNNPFHSIVVLSTNNPLPAARIIQLTLTNDLAAAESVEAQLITVTNVHVAATGNFASGGNYTITNALGDRMQIRIDTRVADIIGKAIPTGPVSITGLLAQNLAVGAADRKAGFQILPTRYADIVTHPPYSILAAKGAGSTLVLTWTAQSTSTYSVLGAATVTNVFTNVVSGLSFPGGSGTYTVPATEAAGFYRVVTP